MNISGAVSYVDGSNISNSNCLRSTFTGVERFECIQYARCVSTAQSTGVGIAFYSTADLSSFISGVQGGANAGTLSYVDDIVPVPAGAKYARFTSWANVSGFYVKGVSFRSMDRGTLEDLGVTALTQCFRPGHYRSGATYGYSITDMPEDFRVGLDAFNLYVTSPAYAGNDYLTQELISVTGYKWRRTLHYYQGIWQSDIFTSRGNWTCIDKNLESTIATTAEPISWAIGTKDVGVHIADGHLTENSNLSATRYISISGFSKLRYSRIVSTAHTVVTGMAFYSDKLTSSFISSINNYAAGSIFTYQDCVIDVPEGARYARFSVISENVDDFYIYGFNDNYKLRGKKLSLLGDSISSMAGYIPEGNDAYYSGSNHGVGGVDQMYWKILCDTLGMTPLVIDAWSGSSICYNFATDDTHADTNKIPMCSDLRTGRLGTDSENPDIIIIAGGTNDWTYSESITTPIGDWDGKTSVDRSKVLSGTSTFMESYASMIQQLQTNYPKAIIVCASCFFTCRGTSLGCTHVNDTGHPTSDYNDAIEKVCKIMGVPYINIYDVGFNFNNYYPTYAEDSQTIATHPNATGHRVIAKRFIDRLPGLVKQFYT